MLRVIVLLLTTPILHCWGQLTLRSEPNVLTPPYFNIATGKKIEATATCGKTGPQRFCKLTGGRNEDRYDETFQNGASCDVCDDSLSSKSHPIRYAIDGTEKWWQSPPLSQGTEYNRINITINLGQVYHVAYIILKFANSPRAGTWVLERSSDHGKTFHPWQYFASTDSDCANFFGINPFKEITRDDTTICTSKDSDVVPLEGGEVIVSMINKRPGANNFSHSLILQEWTKATDIRLRLIRTKTLLAHLMAVQTQDPTVTRRYYYSIKDISIGGRCVCNGHADTCLPDEFDRFKLVCQCRHHACGDSCEQCCPGFVQKAWRVATPESSNECEECNCHGHSAECYYDEDVDTRRQSLDKYGNYEGGGVCLNCSHHTAGINCENCMDGYYRLVGVDLTDPEGCMPCECNSSYTVGTCEPLTGRCYCKPQYDGDRCDRCAPGYRNFPECEPCPCYYDGTRNGVCEPGQDNECPCKYTYGGMYCNECAAGFYKFPECIQCQCLGEGALNDRCDAYTGQCDCEVGFGGLLCDSCAPGYFEYPSCHRCFCNTGFTTAEICDSNDGTCFCTGLATGDSCNQCKLGYFDFPQCAECGCSAEGSHGSMCNRNTGQCDCKVNYGGLNCDECAPEYYNYPFCVPCNCNVRGSLRTACEPDSGDCTCRRFIAGRQCDQCAPQYFNFPICEDCKCDPRGIKEFQPGVCLAFTAGQCDCKEHVIGMYCDECDALHYDLSKGCIGCNCLLQGTLDGVAACNTKNGNCWCKIYAGMQQCSECKPGFYGLSEANYFACHGCQCDRGGSLSDDCDPVDGQCLCKPGLTGRKCDRVIDGYYSPTVLQYQFEVENGRTPDGEVLRFGFNEKDFPGFSDKGYAEFSYAQHKIVVPIAVQNHTNGLYHVYVHYMQPYERSIGNITFNPITAEGSSQAVAANFDVTIKPTLLSVGSVFVFNPGQWEVEIEAKPGLLIDYIVLISSEYYEASVLQAKVVTPCMAKPSGEATECIMYTHPSLNGFLSIDLTEGVETGRLSSPLPTHAPLLMLDGQSILGYNEFEFVVTPPEIGKYVLVLEYSGDCEHMHTIEASVTDGQEYENVKFNIYTCGYAFLCRQVALSPMDEVMVFDISFESATVRLSVNPEETALLSRVHAIPYDEWNMEYVEPKRRCVIIEGTNPNECVPLKYPVAETGRIFDLDNESAGESAVASVDAKYITDNETIVIDMNLSPGRYVFLLHYFNSDHLSFYPNISLFGGITYEGVVKVNYCPSVEGCRAIFMLHDDSYVLDITNSNQVMTITVPTGKAFWLDYILVIPQQAYRASFLHFSLSDYSRKFFKECIGVGTEGLIDLAKNPSQFCLSAIFTLTASLNDGAVICECSPLGTIGGAEADCQAYGGKCPCRPNVIGRTCEKCATGFHSYPDCKPCDCNGLLCDEINGNCICPPNTIEPNCTQCAPFTHSYHLLAGCVACECDREGVNDTKNLGCSVETGQCQCKENVEGLMCGRCKPGFFAFPECRPCVCNTGGSKSDVCDADSGQCNCKENVHGQHCDQCKPGTFHLYDSNPVGCTSCFCFGAAIECSSSLYPETDINEMDGWNLLNTKVENPPIVKEYESISVSVADNGGPIDSVRAGLYWSAPQEYLGKKLGSYGGTMSYIIQYKGESRGRGDSIEDAPPPALLNGIKPHVILQGGGGFVIGWTNPEFKGNPYKVKLKLLEANFIHQTTGNPVTREDMMMILEDLTSIQIKATDDPRAVFVRLWDVSFPDTNYNLAPTNISTNPSVETCVCPKGYTGESCEACASGFFRDSKGPYLGYCVQCDCFEHCEMCNASGNLMQPDDCLHNTAGDRCDVCKDGYYGDPTTRDSNACKICPCPHSTLEGSHASSCGDNLDGDLVCDCDAGYTGQNCEFCEVGYHGNPLVIGGKCEICDCNGNSIYGNGSERCNQLTGVCTECKEGFGGKHCEFCADGFFGDAIDAKNCSKCDCLECGTSNCDRENGQCRCLPHVIGEFCDTCETGFYNLGSCRGCKSCECGLASTSTACTNTTGECPCAPNVVGLKCDKCAEGHWDYSEDGCKPCDCGNVAECNPVTGECNCPPGTKGRQCEQCELPRHIIPKGQILCKACGNCTNDLLDTVDNFDAYVKKISQIMASISASVTAKQKYSTYQNELWKILSRKQSANYALVALKVFFATENREVDMFPKSFMSTGSGSGMEEFGSGVMEVPSPFFNEQTFTDLVDTSLDVIENSVSGMCTETQTLLEKVESTESDISVFETMSNDVKNGMNLFYDVANEFIMNLTQEASGDEIEFYTMFDDVQALLNQLKSHNYDNFKISEEAELSLAKKLYENASSQFLSPATDLTQQNDDIINYLKEKETKLQAFRQWQNSVTSKIIHIKSLNAENNKILNKLKNQKQDVFTLWSNVLDIHSDSSALVTTPSNYTRREVLTSDSLRETFTEWEQYRTAINSPHLKNLAEQVIKAKSASLQSDSNELIAVINVTIDKNATARTIASVQRYSNMIEVMTAANNSAFRAKLDASEALQKIEDRDLANFADGSAIYARELLLNAQKLRMKTQSHKNTLEASNRTVATFNEPISQLINQVESLESRIDRHFPVNMLKYVDAAEMSLMAKDIVTSAMQSIARVRKKMSEAPDPSILPQDIIDEVTDSINITGRRLNKATNKLRKVQDQVAKVKELRQNLNLEDKIKKIRRMIDLSRDVAGTATVSMKFKPASGEALQYVEPRLPPAVAVSQDYTNIELYVNVSTRPDNAILYWGDTSYRNGHFMALETEAGYLHYKFRIGRGIADIKSANPINDNKWHKVQLQRIGNFGQMTVQSPNTPSGVLDGDLYTTSTTSGTTTSKEVKMILPNNVATKFVVGGMPPDIPPRVFGNRKMKGCIQNLVVNGQLTGLWNFIAYNGPKPGQICQNKPSIQQEKKEMWRFRGGDSYIRVKNSEFTITNAVQRRVTIVQFKITTMQSNALLFFVGQSRRQFFAVELRDGKYVVTFNFGWDTPRSAVAEKFDDINTYSRPVLVKAAVVLLPRTRQIMVILASNNQLGLNVKFSSWNPNITGDAWVGGIHPDFVLDDLRRELLSLQENFRGCLGGLAFHIQRQYSIYNADEKLGVTRGCDSETVVNFEVTGADFIVSPLTLPNVEQFEGFLTVRTESANGSIIIAEQRDNGKQVTLEMHNGHIKLIEGSTDVETMHLYNDGQPHTIVFKRNSDCSLHLNVDDEEMKDAEGSCEEVEEEYEQVRRARASPRLESTSKVNLFAMSHVYLYLGGSIHGGGNNFTGCIGNIRIIGDAKHPGLLTSDIRCGSSGTVRCYGTPQFNKCNMQSAAPQESVGQISTVTEWDVIGAAGQVPAGIFTQGSILSPISMPGKDARKKPIVYQAFNNSRAVFSRDNQEIEAVDIIDSRFHRNCFLPLKPENTGLFYPGDGYSKYSIPNIDSFYWRFSLYMRTISKEGILFFLCGADCSEHIALYLVKGKITLKVRFNGEGKRIRTGEKYNDGNWHLVTFERRNLKLKLIVDGTADSDEMYEYSRTFSDLLFFYIGGLQETRRLSAADYVHQDYLKDFEGCVRNLVVNDWPISELHSPSLLYKLNVRTCFEGDTESGIFFSDSSPVDDGAYVIVYNTYNVGSVLEIDMEIRPRSESGVLFAVGGDNGDFFQLTLIDGKVVARVKQGSDLSMCIYDPSHNDESICDGEWHKIRVGKSRNSLTLTVDGYPTLPENIVSSRNCNTNGPLYMGGVPRDAQVGKLLTSRRQYTGCMRNVNFDFFPITTSIAVQVMPGVSDSCPLR